MTRPTARPQREAPEPLEGPVVATITVGTIIWFVMFLGQLPFYNWFSDHDHTWWIWTCLTGAGLGCFGIWYVRARDKAIKRAAAEKAAQAAKETSGRSGTPGTSGDGERPSSSTDNGGSHSRSDHGDTD